MDFLLLKKISLLFLLISASLSISCAGQLHSSVIKLNQKREGITHEEHHGKMSEVHERLLRVNTKDYGRLDPHPGLAKPLFKPAPN